MSKFPRNSQKCDYSPDPQSSYRFAPEKKKDRDTLVVVTFSGGGIRASALAYGTLRALEGLPGVHGASLPAALPAAIPGSRFQTGALWVDCFL